MRSRQETNTSYWQGFITHMGHEYPQYEFGKVSKEAYQVVPPTALSGRVKIAAGVNRRPLDSIRVDLTLTSDPPRMAEQWYRALEAEKTRIKADVGISDGTWEWEERPGKPESHIIFRRAVNLEGPRLAQYKWLAEAVHHFHEVFGPRIDALSKAS